MPASITAMTTTTGATEAAAAAAAAADAPTLVTPRTVALQVEI
jgi:hypothetical protein